MLTGTLERFCCSFNEFNELICRVVLQTEQPGVQAFNIFVKTAQVFTEGETSC